VNPTDRVVNLPVAVTADGELLAHETVTVDPRADSDHLVEFAATAGPVAVNGVPAGRLDVGAGRVGVSAFRTTSGPTRGVGGTAALGGLAVLGCGLLFLLRR
jgi:hypothetical protein